LKGCLIFSGIIIKKKREVAPTLEGQQIFFLKVEPLRVAKLKKKELF
jgi:hypothetical protein